MTRWVKGDVEKDDVEEGRAIRMEEWLKAEELYEPPHTEHWFRTWWAPGTGGGNGNNIDHIPRQPIVPVLYQNGVSYPIASPSQRPS